MISEKIILTEDNEIKLVEEDITGDENQISISYKGLCNEIKVKDRILIDDGLIELEVKEIENKIIISRVVNSGNLGSRKTVSIPNLLLNIQSPTKKDFEDIEWGIKNKLAFVALSFTRNSREVKTVRKLINKHNSKMKIISKIENQEGLDNFNEILEESDGIMVARGDLAVEVPAEKVPLIQKDMIRKCNIQGKPVITATQMLESMVTNPRPTRAEANDVANAVIDGTDAVMLSGETAKGSYPVEAVAQMSKICKYTEDNGKIANFNHLDAQKSGDVSSFITHSVYHASKDLKSIKAIIAPTKSGFTARQISRFKPDIPVLAFIDDEQVARQLNLSWGVIPVIFEHPDTTCQLIHRAITKSVEKELVKKEDLVIVTAGVPIKTSGTTNMLEIYKINEYLKYKHQSGIDK